LQCVDQKTSYLDDMKLRSNRLLLLCLLWGFFASPTFAQTTVHGLVFEGLVRSYRVHVPPTYNGATAVPLVFNLHGYTSNAFQQEFYSGMNLVADTANFIVCYPDGLNNEWNSGFTIPYYGGVNDVGFISVLIDSLQAAYNIDPARVYSCGMSNGGFMSYRLACDLEQRIAAIASVTGSMTVIQLNNCQATRPVPVLEIHGTNDLTVPYTTTSLSMGIDSVLRYWRGVNACPNPVVYDTLPDINVGDQSTVTSQWSSGCQGGTEVAHFKIANGSHTWAGASFPLTGLVTNQDIDASVEIWKFFSRFSHPAPVLLGRSVGIDARPTVAPNPCRERLEIHGLQAGARVTVRDLHGRVVAVSTADGDAVALNAAGWASGLYMVEVLVGEGRTCLRVVKE
jgi:polyhydroxybutyrate depolymerase